MRIILFSLIAVAMIGLMVPSVFAEIIVKDGGGDCHSIGIWTSSNKTCMLTTDVFEQITVRDSGITLDGNGHTITVDDSVYAAIESNEDYTVIKNFQISGFFSKDTNLTRHFETFQNMVLHENIGINLANGAVINNQISKL